jgi:hypothetical protein
MGNLTAKGVESLKVPSGEKFFADGNGLYLRVRAEGTVKVWFYRYTMNGTARKIQLGVLADMSLAEAREEANKLTTMRRLGNDPVLVAEKKALDEEKAKAARAEAEAKAAARLTVAALLDRWQADYLATKRKDGGAEIRDHSPRMFCRRLVRFRLRRPSRGAWLPTCLTVWCVAVPRSLRTTCLPI